MADTPIIDIQNVTFTYPGAEQPTLNDVSLTIKKGEFVAFIGRNGCGKSTLCKTLNGLIPHYYVGDFSGTVITNGLNTSVHNVADLSRHVGYIYQDFENQLVRPTVEEDVRFTRLNYGFRDFKERAAYILAMTGLAPHAQQFIWQLSGGQMHLLALAGALAMDPDIMIIDEPIAQLDPQHAREIYTFLKKLNQDYGKTIVVIEHHTEFIADFCDQVVLMDQGKLLWKKPAKEALTRIHELTEKQIFPPQVTQAAYAHMPNLKPETSYPVTLDEAERFFRRADIPFMTAEGQKNNEQKQGHDHPLPVHSEASPLIVFDQVSLAFKTMGKEKRTVLQNLDLSIHSGDRLAIVGNNGAGKSTMLRLISAILKPTQGKVVVDGLDTRRIGPEKLSGKVALIYQNPEEMFIEDSIRKDMEYFLKARKHPRTKEWVDELLERFELTHLQHRDGRLLSGGQQRKASMAIGAAMNPQIMMLDEPTANLDMATRRDMLRMFEQLQGIVDTVIIATHDMQLVAEWSNRIFVMHQGHLLQDGDTETVFNDHTLLQTAGLVPPQIMELAHRLWGSEYNSGYCYSTERFLEALRYKGSQLEAAYGSR
ncbi:ABC transporter ATP-binding protein [Marinicrinis lubricantis]|uniref:ABC transporter ATP-binding protein n=1 Tax=Marinicrinis lubricantis TaxID=2086470 RepID=A0ABW1IP81_9BACL